MLYGKPTKHIRHVDESTIVLEPQRFYVWKMWACDATGATARTDGQDLQDDKDCPLGSRITKHKLEMLVTPETIEPQQLYIGRIKLSFHDIFAEPIIGGTLEQASYQDTATENFEVTANNIGPHLYPNSVSTKYKVQGAQQSNQEIGGSGSGYGIQEWMLDDKIKHFINLKKVTVFDQRPLMGERWQRIPSKVKRINPFTFYGLFFFNDSARGATPADTQVTINIKQYFEEMAI